MAELRFHTQKHQIKLIILFFIDSDWHRSFRYGVRLRRKTIDSCENTSHAYFHCVKFIFIMQIIMGRQLSKIFRHYGIGYYGNCVKLLIDYKWRHVVEPKQQIGRAFPRKNHPPYKFIAGECNFILSIHSSRVHIKRSQATLDPKVIYSNSQLFSVHSPPNSCILKIFQLTPAKSDVPINYRILLWIVWY